METSASVAAGIGEELFADGGETGALLERMDWSATLGPVAAWPKSLRTCVRIIMTSRQPMFVWWGPALINLYNDAYRAIVGGKHPGALGRPAAEVWSEIWDQIEPRVRSAMERNRGTYDEALLLIMERNGYQEETYYTFSYSPVPDDDGSIGGIICANTDETTRIVDERRLAVMRELTTRAAPTRTWQQACTACAAALATETRDLPFALIHVADDDRRGVRLAASAGIAADHPVAAAAMGADPWRVRAALATREPQVVEVDEIGALPSGAWTVAPRRVVSLPILPAGGAGRAGVLTVGLNPFRPYDAKYRDFLALVAGQIAAGIANAEAYEEERRRAEALAELDRAKTAFFSNVSHEFRTPLTLMLGPVEDALADDEEPLPPRQRERQELVQRNAQRLQRLVNSLLDFARIEAGRMTAAYAPHELGALTGDLASTFRSAVEHAGMRLVVDCPPLAQAVHVDRDMWEKIVLNLLSNAFKHTFSGVITVTLREVGGWAELAVADTGVGIPDEQLPRLFERFHRVVGARSRTHEGTGIGLALVQELVRMHGGSVAVASRVDHGSTFTVRIPLGAAHLPRDQVRTAPPGTPSGTQAAQFVAEAERWLPTATPSPTVAGTASSAAGGVAPLPEGLSGRILVADDNADMRDYVQRLLARHWQVETVADGAAALAAARARPPDLIISDVMMPGLDGFGLVRELRGDERIRHLPVILLSARAGEEASIEGLATGADDYLTKPFSGQELLARVTAHLRLRRIRDQAAQAVRAQEERFRGIVDQSLAGIAESDADGRFTTVNDRFCAITGYSRAELMDLTKRELTHPADRAETDRLIARLRAAGTAFEIEKRYLRRDGGEVWVHNSVSGVRDAAGAQVRIVTVSVDIGARKRIEEALRHRTEQYATLLNQAPIGVYVVDATLRIRELNPVARPAFIAEGGLIGERLADVIGRAHPEAYVQEVMRRYRHTLATGEPYVEAESVPDPATQARHEWRIDRIAMPDGGHGVVCYFRDITRQVAAREELARQAEDLRRVNVELENFASIASHDLQEPLRMIASYADLLLHRYGPLFDERGRQYFGRMIGGAERMRALIQAVLGYSQVGKTGAALAPVALAAVVAEALENLHGQIAARGAEVAVGDLPTVTGDAVRLAQLFQNLVANAIKFTPLERTPAVRITARDAGEAWDVSVSDNGIGISADARARIFQIFQRLHPAEEYPGSGIGLATCKKIVEQHGGTISVVSQPGTGSTFHVTLPKRPPADEAAR